VSSEQDLVVETVRDILDGFPPFVLGPDRVWDHGLWTALVETGLTGVGRPEEAGGSGGELADAVAVVATLAAGAAAVPMAEHLLVAGPALLAAGLPLPPPDEPVGVALDGLRVAPVEGGGWTVRGTAVDVAWAGVLRHLVVLADGPDMPVLALVALDPQESLLDRGTDLAGQPRGPVSLDDRAVAAAAVDRTIAAAVRARFALARSVQISAALQQILAWTVQYAGERQQFGRPIAKFQAVQMELAEMAGEVTAVAAVVDAAVQVLERGGDLVGAAAAAKVRAGAAVDVVARLAHQVHGAIGFTQEYRLHHLTRRCWSWRDDAGNETTWARILGERLLAEPDGLWPALTRVL